MPYPGLSNSHNGFDWRGGGVSSVLSLSSLENLSLDYISVKREWNRVISAIFLLSVSVSPAKRVVDSWCFSVLAVKIGCGFATLSLSVSICGSDLSHSDFEFVSHFGFRV